MEFKLAPVGSSGVQKAITFSLDLVVNRVSERYHNIKEG
jgi:hypothetical protein